MGLFSGIGRILFASFFLYSAWHEYNAFGTDGGTIATVLRPKFNNFTEFVAANTGVQVPGFDVKHIIAAGIALKGIGGILFIFGSVIGAFLLLLHLATITPLLHDLPLYGKPEFLNSLVEFTQNLAFVGALLFFIRMKSSIQKRSSRKRPSKSKTS